MLPHLAGVVDDICIVKSMQTDQFNHGPAQIFLNTGFAQPGRPSMGSWVAYGLGAVTENLPAFIVMSTGSGISGGAANWASGFMPTIYAGVRLRNGNEPILNVNSPAGFSQDVQHDTLDLVERLNRQHLGAVGDPEIATRISAYEMACRLQTSAPELTDLRSESRATLAMYGCEPERPSFARACLLARRMVERGVRFVNIYHEGWDAHTRCRRQCPQQHAGNRPRLGRPGARPQAARHARRDAGDLGRRVRAHADGREQSGAGPQPGPRPSPAGVHDLAGRRRRQGGHHLWQHRRIGLPHCRKTLCMCTICRRRFSTCWGWITNGSRSTTAGGITG